MKNNNQRNINAFVIQHIYRLYQDRDFEGLRAIGLFKEAAKRVATLRKIDMVKAVDGREFNNVAGFPCSYRTTFRRVAIQGLVCSPRMVVIQIRRHK